MFYLYFSLVDCRIYVIMAFACLLILAMETNSMQWVSKSVALGKCHPSKMPTAQEEDEDSPKYKIVRIRDEVGSGAGASPTSSHPSYVLLLLGSGMCLALLTTWSSFEDHCFCIFWNFVMRNFGVFLFLLILLAFVESFLFYQKMNIYQFQEIFLY